jgi:hypothetical protein
VTDQKFHHGTAAGLRHSHEWHIVDQDLAKFGVGGQEFLGAGDVVVGDRLRNQGCDVEWPVTGQEG